MGIKGQGLVVCADGGGDGAAPPLHQAQLAPALGDRRGHLGGCTAEPGGLLQRSLLQQQARQVEAGGQGEAGVEGEG